MITSIGMFFFGEKHGYVFNDNYCTFYEFHWFVMISNFIAKQKLPLIYVLVLGKL